MILFAELVPTLLRIIPNFKQIIVSHHVVIEEFVAI
jgi:hypothetical protein